VQRQIPLNTLNPTQEIFEAVLADAESDVNARFDELIALGQRQVWIFVFAVMLFLALTAVYAIVLGQVRIANLTTGWVVGATALPLLFVVAVFLYNFFQRDFVATQCDYVKFAAEKFIDQLVTSIRMNAQTVERVPVQGHYRLDEETLLSVQRAVDDVLRGSERYRSMKRAFNEKSANFSQRVRFLVGRSAINVTLTLLGTAFVALQSFDLVLDFLHYTRTEPGMTYRHREFFQSMDGTLLNNIYFVAIAAIVVMTFGFIFVLVIFMAARYSIAPTARQIARLTEEIDKTGPSDEQLMQITSGLVRRLVELFSVQARRPG